ncbi:MAG: hypothetical protein JSV27_10845 [Candidatus Bathyarchaeota archaeon]|nr:MAG: hypothetical protein JSV27_10845 [Candidatus Bathyarchaeota archaeon]
MSDEERLAELEANASQLLERKEEFRSRLERLRAERDQLNDSVKSLRAEASKEKDKRNQLNDSVAEVKKLIEQLRRTMDEKRGRLDQLDDEREGRSRLPPRWRLEQELQRIEWELSTTPTLEMRDREDQLADRTSELNQALEEHDRLDSELDRRLMSLADSKAVEVEIRGRRDKIQELHEQSQVHHERMLQLYRMADEEKGRADGAHARFVEALNGLKGVDAELDVVMAEVRALRKGVRESDRLVAQERERSAERIKKDLAAEARRKLEAGEKLTLEEMKLIYAEGL